MNPSPSPASKLEAAASQMLSKLNRSGAIDRLRKAVESRMTGDTRRMDKVHTDIANYLNEQTPATSSDKLDTKRLVALAKKQVLTPALEQDLREDIEEAMSELDMRALFDAEVDRLSQVTEEVKKVDITAVRARERKAFLANIIKPMNGRKQQRGGERKTTIMPRPAASAISNSTAVGTGSRQGGRNAHVVRNGHRERKEGKEAGRLVPTNGKKPRVQTRVRHDGDRIPPSAAKPPAGPHRAEVRRVVETVAGQDKALSGKDALQKNGTRRQSSAKRKGDESSGDMQQSPKGKGAEKQSPDKSAEHGTSSMARGREDAKAKTNGKTINGDERCKKVGVKVEKRPRSNEADTSVAEDPAIPQASPRKSSEVPPGPCKQAKAKELPATCAVMDEATVEEGRSAIDRGKAVTVRANAAICASLENEKDVSPSDDVSKAESDDVEKELPLLSWRRPAPRSSWKESTDDCSWSSDPSSEGSHVEQLVSLNHRKTRRTVSSPKQEASPVASDMSSEDHEEFEEQGSDPSDAESPGSLSPTGRTRHGAKKKPQRPSRKSRAVEDEKRARKNGREREEPLSTANVAEGRVRKFASNRRLSKSDKEGFCSPKAAKKPLRLKLCLKEDDELSDFESVVVDVRRSADRKGSNVGECGDNTGTSARRIAGKRPRVENVPSNSENFRNTEAEELFPATKRRRVPLKDMTVSSPYDYVEQQKVLRALLQLAKEPHAYPFLHPVDPNDEGCENYYNEVPNPMNVFKITERLQSSTRERGYYSNVDKVMQDIELIWSNCQMFNGYYDPVVQDADMCCNSLDILLEKEGVCGGVGGRSKRRRSRGKLLDRNEEENDRGYSKVHKKRPHLRTPKSRKERLARQAELAKQNEENDGRFVGEDIIVFTKEGSKKSWLPIDVLDHDPDSCTYTIRWKRSGVTMTKVNFGPFTSYPIVRIAGEPL